MSAWMRPNNNSMPRKIKVAKPMKMLPSSVYMTVTSTSPPNMLPKRRKLSETGRNAIEMSSRKPTKKKITTIMYLMNPELSPLGPKMCNAKPRMPLDRSAQINQSTVKIAAIAKVMFKSALPPRSNGRVISKPCSLRMPQPIVPTPGIKPNQFVNRMKMKIVAKNQNVFFTRSRPMMPSRNS